MDFYEYRTATVKTEEMVPTRRYYGEDFCVMEHQFMGPVPGTFLGVPGNGKRVSFRLLHVWQFRDGLISARTRGSTAGASSRSSPATRKPPPPRKWE